MCHNITFICTARVIHHQHRSHHGSGGYLMACSHGSQGSIPGQFMLICVGEIGQIFLWVLWFSSSVLFYHCSMVWFYLQLILYNISNWHHHKIKHSPLSLSLRGNEVDKGLKFNKYGKSGEVTSASAHTKCHSSVVSVCVIYLDES